MKRIHEIWIILIVVGALAFILFPVFARFNEGHHDNCQSNLKQIGLGFLQYTQDYDEKLPGVSTSGGWANALQPYLKSTQIFQCPTEPNVAAAPATPALTGYTDYFYNSQLQNRKIETLAEFSRSIMGAEGNDGQENTDASYSKPGIPPSWRTASSSPAFRHLDTANYLFGDGHVKALKVGEISTKWDAHKFFFQPPKLTKK